jgi:hypothetical protein
MSTIVYKDGVLASDKQINQGQRIIGQATKIFDLGDKIAGAVGTSVGCTAKQAVECAAKLDHCTGDEIEEIEL